jgi:hypothetical protein
MADIFRTLIVPDAFAPLARSIAGALSGSGVQMWTTALSADGTAPATHWVSTGWIPPAWQIMVPTQFWRYNGTQWIKTGETPGDPILVYQQATAAGVVTTQAEVDALFAVADVTELEPLMVFDRLGLMFVVDEPQDADA